MTLHEAIEARHSVRKYKDEIGIIAKISTILAENGIGIFVVSTFNTDFILTQSDRFGMALRLLSDAGYCICS